MTKGGGGGGAGTGSGYGSASSSTSKGKRAGRGRVASVGGGSYSYSGGSKKLAASSGPAVSRARDKTRRQGPRLLDDPANDERLLAAQLERLGLYAANTLGDGSCLFRALSDQMYGTPGYYHVIRQNVCNFLLEHEAEFAPFVDDGNHSSPEAAFRAHVAEMRQPGTYGTQLEIVAFARMTHRDVKVIQAGLMFAIGCEDESPQAKAKRALRNRLKGKDKDEETFAPLYVVYHNWEHYSSARNIAGPHTGLPMIVEPKVETQIAAGTPADQEPLATQEESLILSSLRYPHRHTVTEIRKLIASNDDSWEQALEYLLEQEVDETESEDFNHPSPRLLPADDSALQAQPEPVMYLPDNAHPSVRHSTRASLRAHRSSSPSNSNSSSTATSTTQHSIASTQLSSSTTATQLSDIAGGSDRPVSFKIRLKPKSTSTSPAPSASQSSATTRVRSRNATPDLDIGITESPRQKFKVTRAQELLDQDKEDYSSTGGDDLATLESSSVVSISSGSNGDTDSTGGERKPSPPEAADRPVPAPVPARKRGRPPKKVGIGARGPTRRERKTALKSGATVSSRTRSAAPTPQDSHLQLGFRELHV